LEVLINLSLVLYFLNNLLNILKEIPLVKQYTDSLQQEQTPKQKPTGCLSPDIVRQIEREILGME
jgi:hypothetical protein